MPAPDLQALATMIALAVDHEVVELEGGDRCTAALKADALRIAASHRTLDRFTPPAVARARP
jgi:hypothetical protein